MAKISFSEGEKPATFSKLERKTMINTPNSILQKQSYTFLKSPLL